MHSSGHVPYSVISTMPSAACFSNKTFSWYHYDGCPLCSYTEQWTQLWQFRGVHCPHLQQEWTGPHVHWRDEFSHPEDAGGQYIPEKCHSKQSSLPSVKPQKTTNIWPSTTVKTWTYVRSVTLPLNTASLFPQWFTHANHIHTVQHVNLLLASLAILHIAQQLVQFLVLVSWQYCQQHQQSDDPVKKNSKHVTTVTYSQVSFFLKLMVMK